MEGIYYMQYKHVQEQEAGSGDSLQIVSVTNLVNNKYNIKVLTN